ncbi:MAG TPA: aldehyde dehydrogenase family protein [Solirubrobacteraceae bacterium]|nr:aldehyde dehydrogenase family protein [Solirubrobacteraceae bacterium]
MIATTLEQAAMLIGGQWVEAADGRRIDVENPSRREPLASVARGGAEDVDRAVRAAAAAFPAWRALPARDRGRLLSAIAEDLAGIGEELARTIAAESGNAIRTQARGEAATAADVFRYFGGVASEQKGEVLPMGEAMLSYSVREPLGVVAAIVPWNAPVMLASLKVAMALCTGNTLVLKAAEDAPLGVLRMAEVCAQHLPAGVLNVLTGYGEECGGALLGHPGIAKISFTGSTEVGRIAMRAAAERILPVSLELGGKAPAIVYPDSCDDATVAHVIAAMRFARQGQSCTAGSRLFVHRSIFDEFNARLVAALGELVVGDALDERSDIGSIVSSTQDERVCGYVREALEQGATALTGGLPDDGRPGYQLRPTVLTGVEQSWRVAREEVFGPVLVALPWDDEDEVIAWANDTHYGLAAFVFSHDLDAALRAAHRIEAGWVQVNRSGGQLPGMSYGGKKLSGLGAEYSIEGALEGFTQRKSITIGVA